jgi:hypothetical protein
MSERLVSRPEPTDGPAPAGGIALAALARTCSRLEPGGRVVPCFASLGSQRTCADSEVQATTLPDGLISKEFFYACARSAMAGRIVRHRYGLTVLQPGDSVPRFIPDVRYTSATPQ